MKLRPILLVDDEASIRFGIRRFLERRGFEVEEAASCAEARGRVEERPPSVALLDLRLPDGNGIQLMRWLRAHSPSSACILLTGHGSIGDAVEAMKEGAADFLVKPVELPALASIIDGVLGLGGQRKVGEPENRQEAAGATRDDGAENPFLGDAPCIHELRRRASAAARSDAPILILGETGSGKGVLARWIHRHGPRRDAPFIDLNCASLSRELLESELFGHRAGAFTGASHDKPGLFEAADGGTLFLDEIGDMPPEVQPKLLKVIEGGCFRPVGEVDCRQADVRLIAATHPNLEEKIDRGLFRRDLLFRINTLPLKVPPLRERPEDIEPLARALLQRLAGRQGARAPSLAEEALQRLRSHPWPGNIRELRNVLHRALLLAGGHRVGPDDLWFDEGAEEESGSADADAFPTLLEIQIQHIRKTLHREGGNVAAAAERLGMPVSTLYQKIKEHGIDRPDS